MPRLISSRVLEERMVGWMMMMKKEKDRGE